MAIDPATGNSSLFIGFLSSSIDVLSRTRQSGATQFLVLEISTNLLGGGAGRVVSYDTPLGRVLIDNLTTPSSGSRGGDSAGHGHRAARIDSRIK